MTTYIREVLEEEYDTLAEAIAECQQEIADHSRENNKLQRAIATMERQRQEIADFLKQS